jgi:hypothetical protein
MITYEEISVTDAALQPVRNALYADDQPGYYVFKGFLSDKVVQEMVQFWTSDSFEKGHERFPGKSFICLGCSNFFSGSIPSGNITYHNYFWNKPAHNATYAIAMQIQLLRNRVEETLPFREIYPLQGRSTNFRVVQTLNGEMVVAPHRDWVAEGACDPKRIQATLFLSKRGRDYEGRGLIFETNQGEKVTFGVDVDIEPGDLVLWRYNNEHSVQDVHSDPGQLGFLRMIFPPDVVLSDKPSLLQQLKRSIRNNSLTEHYLLPVYRTLRGVSSDK